MENVEIIYKMAYMVPTTIRISLAKLMKDHGHLCQGLLSTKPHRMELLAELVCNVAEFVEGGKAEGSKPTEVTEAIEAL